MASIKCGGCGLVSPDGTETCRRCHAPLTATSAASTAGYRGKGAPARAARPPETFAADSHVVAIDDDAIFVLRSTAIAATLGYAIAEAIERHLTDDGSERALARLGPISEMRTRVDCRASQLPEEVTARSNFPTLHPGMYVSIYPHHAIECVELSFTYGVKIKLRDEARPHPIALTFWTLGRARRALTERGYHVT